MNATTLLASILSSATSPARAVPAVLAQATGAGGAAAVGGLRAYWHVFIAYAVVIVLVLGWVISIGRRLKDVEQRLGE